VDLVYYSKGNDFIDRINLERVCVNEGEGVSESLSEDVSEDVSEDEGAHVGECEALCKFA
jgi:hypothetical protein